MSDTEHVSIFPATHFVTNEDHMEHAIASIQSELDERLKVLRAENKLLEAQRLEQRTNYDIEMMREMGYTSGIENYSPHGWTKRRRTALYVIRFLPDDFLIVIDESRDHAASSWDV